MPAFLHLFIAYLTQRAMQVIVITAFFLAIDIFLLRSMYPLLCLIEGGILCLIEGGILCLIEGGILRFTP